MSYGANGRPVTGRVITITDCCFHHLGLISSHSRESPKRRLPQKSFCMGQPKGSLILIKFWNRSAADFPAPSMLIIGFLKP